MLLVRYFSLEWELMNCLEDIKDTGQLLTLEDGVV
jgi:hypothetical protein